MARYQKFDWRLRTLRAPRAARASWRVWNALGGSTAAGTDVDIRTRSSAPGTVQEFRFQLVGRVLLGSPTD